MNRNFILLFLLYFLLLFLFPVRYYFTMDKYTGTGEMLYSTHFFLEKSTEIENCIDGNVKTSCKEYCHFSRHGELREGDYLTVHPGECAFVWQISPSHRMDVFPPEANILENFGIYLSNEDLAYGVPETIILDLYLQKLYQINHDYRFPDQPIYAGSLTLKVEKKEGWQFWDISGFNRYLLPSRGFPDNVYQRWLKIRITGVHNPGNSIVSLSELAYRDGFFRK